MVLAPKLGIYFYVFDTVNYVKSIFSSLSNPEVWLINVG